MLFYKKETRHNDPGPIYFYKMIYYMPGFIFIQVLIGIVFMIGFQFGKSKIKIKDVYKSVTSRTHLKVLHKKIPVTKDEERIEAIKNNKKILKSFRK